MAGLLALAVLLYRRQPLQHDRTKRTTEETIKAHSDRGADGAHGKLVVDATVAKEARKRREIVVKRPAQAGQHGEPHHSADPVALGDKEDQSSEVANPGKNESGNGALLQLEGERLTGH